VPFASELNRTGTGSSAEATVEDNRVFTPGMQLDFHPRRYFACRDRFWFDVNEEFTHEW
jgi:hypothetical protein